jgi:hypothetical protein
VLQNSFDSGEKSYPVRRTETPVQRCESAGSIAYMHVDSESPASAGLSFRLRGWTSMRAGSGTRLDVCSVAWPADA